MFTHGRYDLVDTERVRVKLVFRVAKSSSVRKFKKTRLLEPLTVDNAAKLRLYVCARRGNGAVRPAWAVSNNKRLQIGALLRPGETELLLFAEKSFCAVPFFDPITEDLRLVFFKFFDARTGTLSYVTSMDLSSDQDATLRSMERLLRIFVELPEDEPLRWFEEVCPGRVEAADPTTLLAERVQNGDIFVCQTLSEPGRAGIATAPRYYQLLESSVVVEFFSEDSDNDVTVLCHISSSCEQVVQALAARLPREYCDDPYRIELRSEDVDVMAESLLELLGWSQPAPLPTCAEVSFRVAPADVSNVASIEAAEPAGDERLCVVCLERQKTHVLIPCGHLCVCEADSVLRVCPLCRANVASAHFVYQ
jgi:hypothetical protein